MQSLDTKALNVSLANGYTSEGLRKEGSRMTFYAAFSGMTEQATARLEQSVDGVKYNEIPDSETTIPTGDTEQMWNDPILPSGSYVRLVVEASNGTLTTIKMLS